MARKYQLNIKKHYKLNSFSNMPPIGAHNRYSKSINNLENLYNLNTNSNSNSNNSNSNNNSNNMTNSNKSINTKNNSFNKPIVIKKFLQIKFKFINYLKRKNSKINFNFLT